MKIDNSPPKGTRDLLPATVAKRDHVLSAIAEVYRRYGYQRIDTPGLESVDRLTSGQGGENEKLIFRILRRGLGGHVDADTKLSDLVDLALRFDLTVPLTRFYGNNHAHLPLPFRSFQCGPVWRAERPQRGRYRQFHQCDIDIIGEASVLAEIELIEATVEALAAVGLQDTTVRLCDRRFLSALAEGAGLAEEAWDGFFVSLDKLDKIGWEGVCAELVDTRGLPSAAVSAAAERIEGMRGLPADKITDTVADAVPHMDEATLAGLATTIDCLEQLSAERQLRWEFDPTMARGMGYYTGQIFEITTSHDALSMGGGGRYDKLIGTSLGHDVPACGFSIGFERIVDLLDEVPKRDLVALLYDADVATGDVLTQARQLRSEGRSASPVPRRGKFGTQVDRLQSDGFTSFVHLRADRNPAIRPEERTLGQ